MTSFDWPSVMASAHSFWNRGSSALTTSGLTVILNLAGVFPFSTVLVRDSV